MLGAKLVAISSAESPIENAMKPETAVETRKQAQESANAIVSTLDVVCVRPSIWYLAQSELNQRFVNGVRDLNPTMECTCWAAGRVVTGQPPSTRDTRSACHEERGTEQTNNDKVRLSLPYKLLVTALRSEFAAIATHSWTASSCFHRLLKSPDIRPLCDLLFERAKNIPFSMCFVDKWKRIVRLPGCHGLPSQCGPRSLTIWLRLAAEGTPLSPEGLTTALGEGWVAEEALAVALYAVLATTGDGPQEHFRKAIALAVNHSGDSDSTGSIAGNILGALYGEECLPAEWLEGLEGPEVIRGMAARLLAVTAD